MSDGLIATVVVERDRWQTTRDSRGVWRDRHCAVITFACGVTLRTTRIRACDADRLVAAGATLTDRRPTT